MKYLPSKTLNQFFKFSPSIIFIFGVIVVTLNVYFLPFYIWTAGIMRPWYILHGLIPYRDFVWLRTPLDLFIMSGWYKIFGPNPQAYQSFVLFILIILISLMFFLNRFINKNLAYWPFIFFIIFLFPLFQNAEEGEILIGFVNLVLFIMMYQFLQKKQPFYLLATGIITSISILIKQNSAPIIIAIFFTILFNSIKQKSSFLKLIRPISIYSIGISIPILAMILYFVHNESLNDFLYYAVFFVLGKYRSAPLTRGNGLLIILGYISLIIPFIILHKKSGFKVQSVFLLIALIISLFSSLLPSYLSYRAFPAFPLISIIAGINFSFLCTLKKKLDKVIILTGFLFFIIFNQTFINSYLSQNTNLQKGQFLKDYGDNQYKIAEWIKTNSKKDEKIISYGSEIIYLLADRLPKNKYIDPFPYLLQPYDVTFRTFLDNPPKIVVFDETLPKDHQGLSDWPFYQFMKKNYKNQVQFGESFIIYQLVE